MNDLAFRLSNLPAGRWTPVGFCNLENQFIGWADDPGALFTIAEARNLRDQGLVVMAQRRGEGFVELVVMPAKLAASVAPTVPDPFEPVGPSSGRITKRAIRG